MARARSAGRGVAGGARGLSKKVATQIKQRGSGESITDRLVSLADPDARPIRWGKLGKRNEFGAVIQICELTEHTRRGARGLIVPASTRLRNSARVTLLPDTLSGLEPDRTFISGRQQSGGRRTQRRVQRYRTGGAGRISHLKRGDGPGRSRLKGHDGRQIWTGWSIRAYNADILAIRAR